MTAQAEPGWMAPCREELMRRDPRWVVVFNARWRVFGGDCSAAALYAHLKARRYAWLPSERSLRTWLNGKDDEPGILQIEAHHRLQTASKTS